MKSVYENAKYVQEINDFAKSQNLSFLDNKTILVAGAGGLVMSYLIDTIFANPKQNTKVIAIAYNDADKRRFKADEPRISYLMGDVKDPTIYENLSTKVDYVINAASIVDPKGYKERPIDTILINLYGTKNLLDVAVKNNATFLLTSSCEVYGEADVDLMKEDYCGKLDPMEVRSCYNESKRACETLCVSYSVEKGIRTLIARLSRTFGPTQSPKDTKALSQFMKNAALDEDIVLKSKGEQLFSYTYIQDIVSGIFTILKKGESMNAYNVNNRETLRLKQVAEICASYNHKKVIFDINDDGFNSAGYSKASLALQDPGKLEALGWKANVPLEKGILHTIEILKDLYY